MSVKCPACHVKGLALLAAVVRASNTAIDLSGPFRPLKSHAALLSSFSGEARYVSSVSARTQLKITSKTSRRTYQLKAASAIADVETESQRVSYLAEGVTSPPSKTNAKARRESIKNSSGDSYGDRFHQISPSRPDHVNPTRLGSQHPPRPFLPISSSSDQDIRIPEIASTFKSPYETYASADQSLTDSNNASSYIALSASSTPRHPSPRGKNTFQTPYDQRKHLSPRASKDRRSPRSSQPPFSRGTPDLQRERLNRPHRPSNSPFSAIGPSFRPKHLSETRTVSRQSPSRDKVLPWQQQKATLSEKFSEGWNPRKKLSPDALDGIRSLNEHDPEKFSTPVLAENFKVSPEVIRRILKSKWKPTPEEVADRNRRWEKRGEKVWEQMREMGLRDKTWEERKQEKERKERREIKKAMEKALQEGPHNDDSITGEEEQPALLAHDETNDRSPDSDQEGIREYLQQTEEKEQLALLTHNEINDRSPDSDQEGTREYLQQIEEEENNNNEDEAREDEESKEDEDDEVEDKEQVREENQNDVEEDRNSKQTWAWEEVQNAFRRREFEKDLAHRIKLKRLDSPEKLDEFRGHLDRALAALEVVHDEYQLLYSPYDPTEHPDPSSPDHPLKKLRTKQQLMDEFNLVGRGLRKTVGRVGFDKRDMKKRIVQAFAEAKRQKLAGQQPKDNKDHWAQLLGTMKRTLKATRQLSKIRNPTPQGFGEASERCSSGRGRG